MKHIVLMGFKHVGKTTVGKALAGKLKIDFVDLDECIERDYQEKYHQKLSCRDIVLRHGENFFREIESDALQQALTLPPMVLALGGGAPLRPENQAMLKSYWLVHVTAQKELVYQRMMQHGKPAFFPENQDPAEFFHKLWHQREPIYDKLSCMTVDNSRSVSETVTELLRIMHELRNH
jgi:shikimate kinase